MRRLAPALLLAVLLAGSLRAANLPGVQHVIILGVDGLSPDGLRKAKTPNLAWLRQNGAWTFQARGVMPTVSSPNWASMIMGAGPEQHGVTSNDWKPDKFEIAPTVKGRGGIFPTVFRVLREQRPRAVIGVFHEWADFARLVEPGVSDAMETAKGPAEVMKRAIAFLNASPPDLLFIHLDHVDDAGHTYGHGTPEYIAAVEEADRLTGALLDSLRESGRLRSTILLVTADHGGVGKRHGQATMAEIEIPWILCGPGVSSGKELDIPVNTYDTAATVAYVLGLNPPSAWIARPVLAAFAR